jgi:formate C-acetyltransferase
MLSEPRVISVEQAKLITKAYREHPGDSVILKRAYALREALHGMNIVIHEGELVVGNRSR